MPRMPIDLPRMQNQPRTRAPVAHGPIWRRSNSKKRRQSRAGRG